MAKSKLWSKNFTIITVASLMGSLGNAAGSFALSFLVFEETSSTFAAALTIALRVIPGFLIPLLLSPLMDRLPRKPFLVGTDLVSSLIYAGAGLWLLNHEFNYIYYMLFSLVLATVGSMDELSFTALYPKLIPAGAEEKGYSVSSMLYPLVNVIMTPIAAILYKAVGVAVILIAQGALSLLATAIESNIRIKEEIRAGTRFSVRQWWSDVKDGVLYMKREKGLWALTIYPSAMNGIHAGFDAVYVAFFTVTQGFTVAMYSFFTVVEMIGRTLGGVLLCKKEQKPEKKYGYSLFIYAFYDVMDMALLWSPYPLMLLNRTVCGFLGIQSGTMRYAAIQKYIPESMRARVTAIQNMTYLAFSAVLSLAVGWLGDHIGYRWTISTCAAFCVCVLLLTVVRRKKECMEIYMAEGRNEG